MLDLLTSFLIFTSQSLVNLSESLDLSSLSAGICRLRRVFPFIEIISQKHLLLHLLPLLVFLLLQLLFVLQLFMSFTLCLEGEICFTTWWCLASSSARATLSIFAWYAN